MALVVVSRVVVLVRFAFLYFSTCRRDLDSVNISAFSVACHHMFVADTALDLIIELFYRMGR